MKLPVGYVPARDGPRKAAGGYGGVGQKLLEKMGWEAGQGLGSSMGGMKHAIEVKKKEDTLGVGVAKGPSWDWTVKYWELAYNSAAQAINHEHESASSSSDDSSDTDDQPVLPRAAAGLNRDGTVAAASEAELKLAAQLAKDPWGRWGGRCGKMARIRQQEQAEAEQIRQKLGLPAPQQAGRPEDGPASTSSYSSSDSERDVGRPQRRRIGSGQEVQAVAVPGIEAAKKRKVIVLEIKDDLNQKRPDFKLTPTSGWWGAKYFASAGVMAGVDEVEQQPDQPASASGSQGRQAFDEGDQEALYMRTHEQKRVGRHGLGKRDVLKIAGGKWEGTKVTFGEDVEGGAAGSSRKKKEDGRAPPKEEAQLPHTCSSCTPESGSEGGKAFRASRKAGGKAQLIVGLKEPARGSCQNQASQPDDDVLKAAAKCRAASSAPPGNAELKASTLADPDEEEGREKSGAAATKKRGGKNKMWLKAVRRMLKMVRGEALQEGSGPRLRAPKRRLKAQALLDMLLKEVPSLPALPATVDGLSHAIGKAPGRLLLDGKYITLLAQ